MSRKTPEEIVIKKPWANMLKNCQSKIRLQSYSEKVKEFEEDGNYRKELKPFINTRVEFVCNYFKLYRESDKAKGFDRILMKDITFKKVQAGYRDITFPTIDHLWVAVDKDWKYRVDARNYSSLYCKGFFFEYGNTHERKNIGFEAVSVKPIK